ncbi:MAG: hypothetical protein JXA21_14110 [Anaerolineae bacterium]|nr:hypothetical protein [Anaerolineae bacterium]
MEIRNRLRQALWIFSLFVLLFWAGASPVLAQEETPDNESFTWGCASVAIVVGFLVLVLTLGRSRKRSRKRKSRPRTRRTTIVPESDYYGPAPYRTRTTRRKRSSRRRSPRRYS